VLGSCVQCPQHKWLPVCTQRNMARVCSFFAKGMCTRGAECPYRHEMPTTGELAEQNIKDRWVQCILGYCSAKSGEQVKGEG